jgi:hypothetical protein
VLINSRTAELPLAYCLAKAHVPELHLLSKLARVFCDLDFGMAKRRTYPQSHHLITAHASGQNYKTHFSTVLAYQPMNNIEQNYEQY